MSLRVLVGMPLGENRGGAERLLVTLARHGPRHGLELHVALLEPGSIAAELRGVGAEVVELRAGRFRDVRAQVRALAGARALVRHRRPGLVLSWLPRAHLTLGPGAVASRAPAAWWQHHNLDGERGLIQAVTALPARGIVCTSRAVAERQATVRPRRALTVCSPGIEPVATPAPERVAAVRERLGVPAGACVVGIPGRLVPWKGQDRLLEAVASLRAQGHDATALVVGGEGHGLAAGWGHRLLARAADLGLGDHAIFTGHLADATEAIAAMDVLVNASEMEPFGMTLVEAMALGVPTVSVRSGGPVEITDGGRAGVLVEDGGSAALARGIAALLDDGGLRARIVAAGRERFASTFTAEAFARRAAATLRALSG